MGGPPLVELPDFVANRDALLATLEEKAVPGALARAMCRPKTYYEDWSAEGALGGDAPRGRKNFVTTLMSGKLYVYGGCSADDKDYYDDVYLSVRVNGSWSSSAIDDYGGMYTTSGERAISID